MKEENLQNNVEINHDDNLYQYAGEVYEFDYCALAKLCLLEGNINTKIKTFVI